MSARHASWRTAAARPVALLSLLTLGSGAGWARETPGPETDPVARDPRTRVMAPGRHYQAGALHRFLFGSGYRSLWQAAIEVEVLDLDTFAGGLKPKKKGGGKQTHSLTFESPDGGEWRFRSIDKDPSAVLPEELRETFVDALVQDQVSAAHPLGPLMVDPLTGAAGILSARHRLVLLPDDERLGAFRTEFGGTMGFLEEKINAEGPVTPGFEGFHKLLDTTDLWKRLDEHPEEKVDAGALLRARLFDLFINDFDRHKDQWRWARRRGASSWLPVPLDRDQAFVRYSGLVLSLIRPSQPRLVDFGSNYPNIFGLTWQGRFVDRRHLSELEWKDWEDAIRFLQSRITDVTIDDAVNQLPEEYRQITNGETGRVLKARLRRLGQAARSFYEQLAADVEVHGSDKDDVVTISPAGNGLIRVRLATEEGGVTFERRFDPRETRSIRIYLKGGDDRVVREAGAAGIKIRVIGGKGEDALDDSRAGGTAFYDEGAGSRVARGPGTSVDNRRYEHPKDSSGNPDRDWGGQRLFLPWLGAGSDLGVFLGGGMKFTTYSFRHHPYANEQVIGAGYSTGLAGYRAEYRGSFFRENRRASFEIHARASEVDLIRFYGLGNETRLGEPEDYFEVRQRQFAFSPQYRLRLGALDLSLGALAQYTREPDRPSLASATRPYGFGGFGKIGPRLDVSIGSRSQRLLHNRSAWLRTGGAFFPRAWSVEHPFGEVHGEAGLFLRAPAPLRPTLALRAGGKKVFGRYPYQDAAFLGGGDTLRGLRPQRYAGDASAFGSAELRLRLLRATLLLPSEVGVFGLFDAGRVFQEGESSDRWHHGAGAGIWLAVLKPENTITVAWARSEGVDRVYVGAGIGF